MGPLLAARRALVRARVATLLVSPATWRAATASARPFAFGGVIQGSYGPPWTHADRLAAVKWMASQGLDTYVHAPKFDAYQRAQWRDPYPPEEMAAFRSEIRLANRLGVAWVPNISPGFPLIPGPPAGATVSRDVCFSCPTDVGVLLAKLEPFFAAGARTLMVSFDDVQKISSHPEDLAAYGNGGAAYGHMTRDLLNAVQRHFQRRSGRTRFRLLTVLADYSGTADTEYLRAARSNGGLDAGITVLWTGITVVATTIATRDAGAYARLVGRRRVGIWDNYPTNDYAGNAAGRPLRLFLGPYKGRDPHLASTVAGIVANVMNEAVANRFALGTLARYVADPMGYEPERAWHQTIDVLGAGRAGLRDALAAVAENSRSSALDRRESTVFVPRRDAFLAALEGPFWLEAFGRLRTELAREARAPGAVRRWYQDLARQIAPFLDRLGAHAATATTAAELLAAQRPALTATTKRRGATVAVAGSVRPPSPAAAMSLLADIGAKHAADLAAGRYMHGDRATPGLSDPQTVGTLHVNENRIDEFVGIARERAATWLPSAVAAGSAVTLTLDGRPVAVRPDGTFGITIPRMPNTQHLLVATDGAGGTTGIRIRAS